MGAVSLTKSQSERIVKDYESGTIDQKNDLNKYYYKIAKSVLNGKIKPSKLETGGQLAPKSIIVTAEQLLAIGFHQDAVTPEMINELNRVLEKYHINTPERIRHFLAQVCKESNRGRRKHERGSEDYFKSKRYGSKYRGVGYIQLTYEYGYQAFATYLALQQYPELGDFIEYKNPANSDENKIQKEYDKLRSTASNMGIDIKKYTDIVEKGYEYTGENYAWESAGYYWETKGLNSEVDKGSSVDTISEKVRGGQDKDSLKERRDYYDNSKGMFMR